jgi:hypothetical protein
MLPTTKRDDSNYCRRERDAADHPIVGDPDNMTFAPETLDIDAGSPCATHQNLGMSSGDARENDGVRHSDNMMQTYRLLDYSYRVTDIQQSQRPSDTTVGKVSKRQKVCDSATAAAGGTALESNQVSTTQADGPNVSNRASDAADNCATPTPRITVQDNSDTLLMTQVIRKHVDPQPQDAITFMPITGAKRKADMMVTTQVARAMSTTTAGQTFTSSIRATS